MACVLSSRCNIKFSVKSPHLPQCGRGFAFLEEVEGIHLDVYFHNIVISSGYSKAKTWEVSMATKAASRRSSFGLDCVQCSNELIAPDWSEYRNEQQVVHHVWHCWKCDCTFETIFKSKSIEKIRTRDDNLPPLLVA